MIDQSTVPPALAGVKGDARIEEPDRVQRAIARRAAEARATVPDLELSAEVRPGRRYLEAEDAYTRTGELATACAAALREVPRANAAYRDGRFELYSRVNIGVIVATDGALMIPTLFDCDRKSADQLARELAELERRAQSAELLAPELGGATFTLWNPGELGVTAATPIIVPPQAAAVAAGALREVPAVRAGAIVSAHVMTLTLACDHRILYGTDAARFLATIKGRLEEEGR